MTVDEFAVRVLFAIVAAGIVLTYIVQGLKKIGAINDGDSGKLNLALAYVVALAKFGLDYFGAGQQAQQATSIGEQLAVLVVTGFTLAAISSLAHWLTKKMGARKSNTAGKLLS